MNSILFVLFLLFKSFIVFEATRLDAAEKKDSEPYKNIPSPPINPEEYEIKYWKDVATNTLQDVLNRKINTNVAKNVIFFMGDGLSIATLTASRIYQGQLKNKNGEEEKLSFEKFPSVGLSKTYCVDKQVPDSACTATAYLSGVKTNMRTIGVSARVSVGDCNGAKNISNQPSSIVKWSQEAGKATGIVTNTRITHASPAGAYAHVSHRDTESDADIKKKELDQTTCIDIAKQLIYDDPGRNLNVIMGGGRAKFLPQTNYTTEMGERLDGANLIDEWKKLKQNKRSTYVTTKNELNNIDVNKVDYLLGLFSSDHMNYTLENVTSQPLLSEMTKAAIQVLRKQPAGYFLFVEGGRIDMAHHLDMARNALHETAEFAKAIEVARDMTDENDTLIVVTADHAHTLTMNGYPARGFDILGIYGRSQDGLPYSTLSYANGPSYTPEKDGHRKNLENDNLSDIYYQYPSLVPLKSETHGGEDVAVYASGPWSHLFVGNYEQNYIPIAEAYAAKIGSFGEEKKSHIVSSGIRIVSIQLYIPIFLFLFVINKFYETW